MPRRKNNKKKNKHKQKRKQKGKKTAIDIKIQTPLNCNNANLPGMIFHVPRNSFASEFINFTKQLMFQQDNLYEFRLLEISPDDDYDRRLLMPSFKFSKPKYKIIMEPGRYPKNDELLFWITYTKIPNNLDNFQNLRFIDQSSKDLVNGFIKECKNKFEIGDIANVINGHCLLFFHDEPFEMNTNLIINKNKTGKYLKESIMKHAGYSLKDDEYKKYIVTYSAPDSSHPNGISMDTIKNNQKLNTFKNDLKVRLLDAIENVRTCLYFINNKSKFWKNAARTLILNLSESDYLCQYILKALAENIKKWDKEIQKEIRSMVRNGCYSQKYAEYINAIMNINVNGDRTHCSHTSHTLH